VKAVLFAIVLTSLPAQYARAQDMKVAQRAAMARVKGQSNAAVTVYEIADFQCPYCARFSREVFPRIDSAYVKTGKVQWVFINFPLPTHANSWAAAEAAMCAAGVSDGLAFWAMHDRLFAAQSDWAALANPASVFSKYAKDSGAPMDAYEACVRDDKLSTLLVRDLLNSTGAGATGTPAFVINNEPIFAGYRPFEEWKEMLEKALRVKASAPK
jgi:protein-disulfide isomerase